MIFIPSNRELKKNNSFKKLLAAGMEFKIVNDENLGYPEEYFLKSPTFKDNFLPRKRQFIFEHARSCGLKYFWTLDDDIQKVEKPDYKAKTIRHVTIDEIKPALRECQDLMEQYPRCGFLTLRSRFFWYKNPKINFRCVSGTPFILWNVEAMADVSADFSSVTFEEDAFVMAQLMGGGYHAIVYGTILPSFNYSWGSNTTDDQIREYASKLPRGSYSWVQRKKVKYKHRRMLSDGTTFLKLTSVPVLDNSLTEYFK